MIKVTQALHGSHGLMHISIHLVLLFFCVSAWGQSPHHALSDTVDPEHLERFGRKVLLHGDHCLVKSVSDRATDPYTPSGSVHVFKRGPNEWAFIERLSMPRHTPGIADRFGFDMEAVGDHVFISAPRATWTSYDSGAIFVYEKATEGYELVQVIDDFPGMTDEAHLGLCMVEHNGDLYASFPGRSAGWNQPSGGIARFVYDGHSWQHVENILPQNQELEGMGVRFAFDGDRIAASALNHHGVAYSPTPTGYVESDLFIRSSEQQSFEVVAIEGWALYSGAVTEHGTFAEPGRIYAFRWNGTNYVFDREIRANDYVPSPGANWFGLTMELMGNKLYVGAPFAARSPANPISVGAVYEFELAGGDWEQRRRFDPPHEPGLLEMGRSLSVQDDTLLIGSQHFTINGVNAGAAFIWEMPFGEFSCSGTPNSTGNAPPLEITGNRSLSASVLNVEASLLPAYVPILLMASPLEGSVSIPGSQGTLCLGGAPTRVAATAADVTGRAGWTIDPAAIPLLNGSHLVPGDTLVFQAWYRHTNPLPTSSFTDAIRVTFR